jgi:hypothetical protein
VAVAAGVVGDPFVRPVLIALDVSAERQGRASLDRATSPGLSTTGALRGSFTSLRGRTRSGRSSVTAKKNRRAAMAALNRSRADPRLRHIQLKAAKIITRRCIRRPGRRE